MVQWCKYVEVFYFGVTCWNPSHFYYRSLPYEGYVFTRVCHSVLGGGWYPSMHCGWYPSIPCSRGGVLSQHVLQWGGLLPGVPALGVCSGGGGLLPGVPVPGGGGGCGDPSKSRWLLLRTVRILLEFILVYEKFMGFF